MAEPTQKLPGMFSEPPVERGFPKAAGLIAGVAILLLVAVLVLMGRRDGEARNSLKPLAAYAPSLMLSDLKMSESTSLSGGKSTYIDGNVTNTGNSTVTGVAVQVLFRNDEAMAPQVEGLPLVLVRTHEPYIDTEPVGADPLGPGAKREFRLTFEKIGTNWNQQVPEIHVTGVQVK